MRSLSGLDAWLIDHAFQRVADRLPEGVSPLLLGRWLVELGLVLPLVHAAWRYQSGLAPSPAGLAVLGCATILLWGRFGWMIQQEDRRSGDARMNGLRHALQVDRLWILVVGTGSVPYATLTRAALGLEWLTVAVLLVSQAALTAGLYLAACQKRPPARRREARRWAFGLQGA